MEAAFLYIKSAIFPINLELLKLKVIYFLFYSCKLTNLSDLHINSFINFSYVSIVFIDALRLHHLYPNRQLSAIVYHLFLCYSYFNSGTHRHRFLQQFHSYSV